MIQRLLEPEVAEAIETRILDTLLPYFLNGAGGDEDTARATIRDQIASYHPETMPELLKVGRIVSLRMSAVDNLRLSIAGYASHEQVKAYWDAAVSLTREADRDVQALDEMRAERRQNAPARDVAQAATGVGAAPASIRCFLNNSR